jgi:uncharacterized protein (TIGR03435 family)
MTAPQIAVAQTASGAAAGASSSLAAYDVVSVKPAHPERVFFMGIQDQPDGIHGETVTVAVLVQMAFSMAGNLPTDEAVTGLPDWAKSDYFSVQAKMGPEQMAEFAKLSKVEQQDCRKAMLQALLADRFKVTLHRESRQMLGYDLVLAGGGPKFKESTGPDPNAPNGQNGKPLTGSFLRMGISKNQAAEVTVHGYSMDRVADFLTRAPGVDHRVTDKTGLTGKYDFVLTFAASRGVGPAAAGVATEASAPDDAPSIFTALQEQLGLKLQRGVGTIDTVVVDHVEKPIAD